MSKATAWVMQIEQAIHAAISQMELAHIVTNPDYIKIPEAPEYCQYAINWNSASIPVIDLSAWLKNGTFNTQNNIVAIMIYRDANQNIQYGGITLSDSPVLEQVNNQQMSALPSTFEKWADISLSCFKNKDDIQVPILDISKIFSKNLTC